MLTLQDCLDMCDVDPEIVDAIARHEHLPSILAAELGNCLVCSASGLALIRRFILDELDAAALRRDREEVRRLSLALKQLGGAPH
jgi:hypothetical protein